MDNFWKNLSVSPVLFVVFSTILSQASPSCDLQKVQTCFTDSEATIRILLDKPFTIEKVSLIQHRYCPNFSIDRSRDCLYKTSRGCTSEDLAPYNLLGLTLITICLKEMNPRETCFTQEGFNKLLSSAQSLYIYEESVNCSFYTKLTPALRLWINAYCQVADDTDFVDTFLAVRFFPYLIKLC